MALKLKPDPETAWRWAIAEWSDSDNRRVLRLLTGDDPIPTFAREWLAAALVGNVKRKRGPKRKEQSVSQAMQEYAAQIELEQRVRQLYAVGRALSKMDDSRMDGHRVADGREKPSRDGTAFAAEKTGLTESQVERIVFPRRRQSIRPK